MKERRSMINFRRPNKAQFHREKSNKRKLVILTDSDMSLRQSAGPKLCHPPGMVPSFYPTRMIDKIM